MQYLARDIMKSDVIAVPTHMDVRELAKLLLEKQITGAPVVDDGGNLVGVVSQHDLVYYNLTRDDELVMDSQFYHTARIEGSHIPQGFQIEDTNTGCVADVMTPVVYSVSENASVETIARLMTSKHIHRVIVRRGRRLAGIISALDVLRVHAAKAKPATRQKKSKAKTASTARRHVRRGKKM